MAEVCMNVSDEFKDKISKLSDLALAKIFENAVELEIQRMERGELFDELDELTKNSKLTDEDCLRLGEQVKDDLFKRLKREGKL